LSAGLPWHKRGFRVHRFVYRGWYIAVLLLGAITSFAALAPAVMLAMDAVRDPLGETLTAIVSVVSAAIGALALWLAIHRLRHPIKPVS